MRNKVISSLTLINFLLTISCTGAEKQETGSEARIEYENGVRVIKNPEVPLYGEIRLELEEDLSLGNEEDSLFYRVADIEVDDEGNIFILDSGNHSVQSYDKKGCLLHKFGREGQGPGDFQEPLDMCLDEDNNIYVRNFKSILDDKEDITLDLFNQEGYYLYKIKLQHAPHIIKHGNIYNIKIERETGKVVVKRYKIKNLNQLKVRKSIS